MGVGLREGTGVRGRGGWEGIGGGVGDRGGWERMG